MSVLTRISATVATLSGVFLGCVVELCCPLHLQIPGLRENQRGFLCAGEKSTVKVVSLVGHPKVAVSRIFKGVDLAVTTINMLWDVVSTLPSPPSIDPSKQMQ